MQGAYTVYAPSATSIPKTYAVTPTVGTPAQYSDQSVYHTAYIRASYIPATLASAATLWIDYKRSADSSWTATSTIEAGGYIQANLIEPSQVS